MANNQKKLKAFVRYDGSGRVVASSLILRKNKPRVGRWYEIPEYLCCNGAPSSTTTTTTNGGGVTPTAFVKGYWLNIDNACNTTTYGNLVFYSAYTVLAPGVAIFTDAALTIPVTAGWVIDENLTLTKLLVGAGGVLSEYVCPKYVTLSTSANCETPVQDAYVTMSDSFCGYPTLTAVIGSFFSLPSIFYVGYGGFSRPFSKIDNLTAQYIGGAPNECVSCG